MENAKLDILLTRSEVAAEMLQNLAVFQQADHTRLGRIESMLVFMLEREKVEQTAKPSTDQARRLAAMGLPAWDEVKRMTTAYQVWSEGYKKKRDEQEQKMREAEGAAVTQGAANAQA